MDQKLYNVAEAAYQQYDKSSEIGEELLVAWLLAEIHFVGTVTDVLSIQLGAWPKTDLEQKLAIRSAHIYREIRQDAKLAEQVRTKGGMSAVGPKEL